MFETLLTKPNDQIINNLVLRNLLGRSYVTIETIDSGHHSPILDPEEGGHHHDNLTESHHSEVQGHSTEGQGYSEDTTKINSDNVDSTQYSSSTTTNVAASFPHNYSGQTDSQYQRELKSKQLNNGAITNSDESSPNLNNEPSEEKSQLQPSKQTKTTTEGKESEYSGKGDSEPRRRHQSDFESELDEILLKVSGSRQGEGNMRENTEKISCQNEEEQLVSQQGK